MTLPSKESRRIHVADRDFRWLKSSGEAHVDVRVELYADPASLLVVQLGKGPSGRVPMVGPGLVAAIIEAALGRGWIPEARQPREFRLEGADELAEQHDLRARRELMCLIIAPFDAGAERVRRTLALAVRELGVQVRQAVDAPEPVTDSITTWIAESDVVLADVSRKNPDVLYEVGFAHALGKSTVLLIDDDAQSGVPGALAGRLIIPYNQQDLATLKQSVRRAVLRTIRGRTAR